MRRNFPSFQVSAKDGARNVANNIGEGKKKKNKTNSIKFHAFHLTENIIVSTVQDNGIL